jgi:hypothetical protein
MGITSIRAQIEQQPPTDSKTFFDEKPLSDLPVTLQELWSKRPRFLNLSLKPLMERTYFLESSRHAELVRFALQTLESEGNGHSADEARESYSERALLWCQLALLPILEHALRCVFVDANDGKLYPTCRESAGLRHDLTFHGVSKTAIVGQYYATLDGFGQRHLHQLLLSPELLNRSADGMFTRNILHDVLPAGAVSILLDMLVYESGPRARAVLSHTSPGIYRFLSDTHQPVALFASKLHHILLLVVLVSLCRHMDPHLGVVSRIGHVPSNSATSEDAETLLWCDECLLFMSSTPSFYHPLAQLLRHAQNAQLSILRCKAELDSWNILVASTEPADGKDSKSVASMHFTNRSSSSDDTVVKQGRRVLTLTDKRSRLLSPGCSSWIESPRWWAPDNCSDREISDTSCCMPLSQKIVEVQNITTTAPQLAQGIGTATDNAFIALQGAGAFVVPDVHSLELGILRLDAWLKMLTSSFPLSLKDESNFDGISWEGQIRSLSSSGINAAAEVCSLVLTWRI